MNENDIRSEVLENFVTLFPNDIKFYNDQRQEKNFVDDIINILKSTNEKNEPIFSDEDILHIYNRFNSEESREKLKVMFNADKEIYKLFKEIIDDPMANEQFKDTIFNISNNLMKLQHNVILSICNPYSSDKPIIKLIDLINKKIGALNEVYINKTESKKFKDAVQSLAIPEENFNVISGGDPYYKKYLKYKSKYVNHKNKLR